METITIHPERLFQQKDYAIVLLNREIVLEADFFVKLWNNASVRHIVDGGANHFFRFIDKLPEDVRKGIKHADIVSGDFDSATEEALNRLKSTNCKVVLTEDQNETDFTKGLRVLRDHLNSNAALSQTNKIVCLCEFTGRLDQILANLNTLHKNVFLEDLLTSKAIGPGVPQRTLFLMSADTLSWLLLADRKNEILFDNEVPNLTCGVMPLMGPTKYSSQGLKWDLTPDMVCGFGGLVSTSNMVVKKTLEIIPEEKHSVFSVELGYKHYRI